MRGDGGVVGGKRVRSRRRRRRVNHGPHVRVVRVLKLWPQRHVYAVEVLIQTRHSASRHDVLVLGVDAKHERDADDVDVAAEARAGRAGSDAQTRGALSQVVFHDDDRPGEDVREHVVRGAGAAAGSSPELRAEEVLERRGVHEELMRRSKQRLARVLRAARLDVMHDDRRRRLELSQDVASRAELENARPGNVIPPR